MFQQFLLAIFENTKIQTKTTILDVESCLLQIRVTALCLPYKTYFNYNHLWMCFNYTCYCSTGTYLNSSFNYCIGLTNLVVVAICIQMYFEYFL